MKTWLAYLLLVCISALATAADVSMLKADRKPETSTQLLKVERDLNEAFKAQDKNTLASLCSDDCVFTDDEGKMTNKTEFVKSVDSGPKVVSYILSDLSVHIYGDTGILTGQWSGTVKTNNEETKAALRFTDTFVRRNERWYAVASHMTRLAQDAAAQ